MNISQRLRTCARHTGLDAVIELLQEAADEIDRLSAGQPEDVTDERQAFEKWLGIRPRGAAHDLAWSAWKARAPRPERVPMTDEEATAMIRETVRGNTIRREGSTSLQIVRATEAYYGITSQAKKEKP